MNDQVLSRFADFLTRFWDGVLAYQLDSFGRERHHPLIHIITTQEKLLHHSIAAL